MYQDRLGLLNVDSPAPLFAECWYVGDIIKFRHNDKQILFEVIERKPTLTGLELQIREINNG